jgi:hypothetical protein
MHFEFLDPMGCRAVKDLVRMAVAEAHRFCSFLFNDVTAAAHIRKVAYEAPAGSWHDLASLILAFPDSESETCREPL